MHWHRKKFYGWIWKSTKKFNSRSERNYASRKVMITLLDLQISYFWIYRFLIVSCLFQCFVPPDGVAEDEHDGNDDDDNKCTTLWPPALTPLSWRLALPLPFPICPGEVDTCLPMRACHIYALHLPRAYQNKHEFHVVPRTKSAARVDKTSPQVQQFRRKSNEQETSSCCLRGLQICIYS